MNEPTPQTDSAVALVSAALVAAQGQVKPAEFDATNPFFKSKYATLGSVIEASREALLKNGLAILQIPTIQDHVVTVKTVIVHASGQTLDGGSMSLPLGESERNSDAQLAGSLITYLKRYSWSSLLGIYADSDDDGNDAPKTPPGAYPKRPAAKPASTDGPASPNAPAATGSAVKATDKHRFKALNILNAAPGQACVGIVEGYLRSKCWITGEQTVMDFPLDMVPTNKEEMDALSEAVNRFERTQREQEQPQ